MHSQSKTPCPKTVAIAGATGFIGNALCEQLKKSFNVVALSRSSSRENSNGIAWRRCDLYSLESCIEALKNVDIAVYLVHSMMPSARLTQARFEDLDIILADNFAKAADSNGIKHAVYVGGLDPETADTSIHLNSRMEVEVVLERWIETVTALRAGLVIGKGGSSFNVLHKVVHRLPVILCPRWTYAKMQPIALSDLLNLIEKALSDPNPQGGCHDIGGPDVMTYKMLIERSIQLLNLKRILIDIPFVPAKLSSWGVGLITNTPQSLIFPLIQSLKHDMLAKNTDFQNRHLPRPKSFKDAFMEALAEPHKTHPSKISRQTKGKKLKEISAARSIQRMQLPEGKDALWVAQEYLNWLPRAFKVLIRAEKQDNGVCRMYLQNTSLLLLELSLQPHLSTTHQAIYHISGGVLLRRSQPSQGIFEFRVVLNKKYVMAAIHDFYPSLPWFIYIISQAKVHKIVMNLFAKHLKQYR